MLISLAKLKAAAGRVAPPPTPADTSPEGRAGQFMALVRELVETAPYAAEGALWAARPQWWWFERLGCSRSTLQRTVRDLTDAKRIKTTTKRVAGSKMPLYREGSPDEKSNEDYARMMCKFFDGMFKKKYEIDPKTNQFTSEAVDKMVKSTRKDYGCAVELAKMWGGDALPILKSVCMNWTDFQSIVHSEIDYAMTEAKEKGTKCGLKHVKKAYPSIPQLLWFAAWRPGMVLEFHLMVMQAKVAGDDPNSNPNAMLAKYGSNDPLTGSF